MKPSATPTAKAAFVAFATLVILLIPVSSFSSRIQEQKRPTQRQTNQKSKRDYSVFKHVDHRKEANGRVLGCSSCHVIVSPLHPDRISAASKPNINSSYPYHDSCFRCHREEVYRGDRPQICKVCHTRVSPLATANDVYPEFPSPKSKDALAREFPGYFPHGLHHSVMVWRQDNARSLFVNASFTHAVRREQQSADVCAVCHSTDDRGVIQLALAGLRNDDAFKQIEADTFKTIPGYREKNAHETCFTCHWQSQKPTKDDCNGCHVSSTDYKTRALSTVEVPALTSNAVKWFADWPSGVPKRFSLKFRHNTHTRAEDGKSEVNNHDLGCTTCHVNITQMTTLNIPKADVQIVSCAPCHVATSAIPVNARTRATIFDEMTLKADGSKPYNCVACHISTIGSERPPCTHFAIIGQPCPR